MATQSEAALENGLIKTLMDNSYERVFIKEEENLKANFKVQLEKHNQKALALIGRAQFTDKEFEQITSKAGHGLKRLKNCAIFIRWKPKTGNVSGSNFSTNANGVRTNFRCRIK